MAADNRDNFKAQVLNAIRIAIKDIKPASSCLNCLWFSEGSEMCTKYKQRPPARVIAFGCSEFEIDDIPF